MGSLAGINGRKVPNNPLIIYVPGHKRRGGAHHRRVFMGNLPVTVRYQITVFPGVLIRQCHRCARPCQFVHGCPRLLRSAPVGCRFGPYSRLRYFWELVFLLVSTHGFEGSEPQRLPLSRGPSGRYSRPAREGPGVARVPGCHIPGSGLGIPGRI